jgi:hypothetical protein
MILLIGMMHRSYIDAAAAVIIGLKWQAVGPPAGLGQRIASQFGYRGMIEL